MSNTTGLPWLVHSEQLLVGRSGGGRWGLEVIRLLLVSMEDHLRASEPFTERVEVAYGLLIRAPDASKLA